MHPVLNLPPISSFTPPSAPLLSNGPMFGVEASSGSLSLEHPSYRALTQATLAKLDVHNPFELWSIHDWAGIPSLFIKQDTMENVANLLVDSVRLLLSSWSLTDLALYILGFHRL